MKHVYASQIVAAISRLGLSSPDIIFERPAIESHGDLSTNVAMVLFKQLKQQGIQTYQSPIKLAESIVSEIQISEIPEIDSITSAQPGFINLKLKPEYFIQLLSESNQSEDKLVFNNEKIIVEYTDPNPFKEFHIGHLYSNAVGESLARLFEASGATVWRADYFGDVGLHVAKSIYGMIEVLKTEGQSIDDYVSKSLTDRQRFLGKSYALGSSLYESDNEAKSKIEILNTHIYPIAQEYLSETENWLKKIDYQPFVQDSAVFDHDQIKKLYRLGKLWSLEYFESLYLRLGTKFNGYYPESKTSEIGYDYVLSNLEKGIFEKSQNAIVFSGEKYGLHTRVFINQHGLPTYEAKELGLAPTKYSDFPYTKSVIITGNEINEYFKVLITALKQINPQLGDITTHIGHGMVRLPSGKMSSRTGNVITGDSLMDQARTKALEIINKINPDLENKDAIADQVGIGAIKFAFLKSNIGSDIIFNFDEALSFTGMSGPYIQYTHARCNSVVQKSNTDINQLNVSAINLQSINSEELSLIKWLSRYSEVVSTAAKSYSPHLICGYLYELCQRFNTFYDKHTILGDPGLSQQRLTLTLMTQKTVQAGLNLLGIIAPDKM